MLAFFSRYWRLLVGIILAPIFGIFNVFKGYAEWKGRYDTIAATYVDIGGWRAMIGYVMNPPTWVPLAVVFVGLCLMFWHFKRVTKEAKSPYLSDAIIVGGRENRPPEYRARFVRNGSNALFYVEYSMSSQMGWTQPRTIKAFDIERFAAGEIVSFPIVQICQTKEGVRWRIGLLQVEDAKEGVLRDMLNGQAHYRGRVTLLTKDNLTQHCYFILATNENSADVPRVTGEQMFSHMFEWEGKIPPNGNHKSLFK